MIKTMSEFVKHCVQTSRHVLGDLPVSAIHSNILDMMLVYMLKCHLPIVHV